ncbi:MAG TPA: outer membrane beta-barrel family protein [Chitinophagaceae bacterium]|nr:outer membrane beta-barrel family protein [Chitinophagaceae bacterium]
MKQRYILLLISMLFTVTCLHAQDSTKNLRGMLKGRLADTASHQVLQQAAIKIMRPDSTTVTQVLSDANGLFTIHNLPLGNYNLQVTFNGYDTRNQPFTISKDSLLLDAGTIYMNQHANVLAGVTVEAPPIIIKKDTTEYNATMYNVKPNATAQDLLNKLPGIDVAKDGTIKAQGETVQRVTVNGQRFFGDDPKLATQNLPSDVIEKIQVFDDQSDQSKFTGFDDGNRVKTINIVTKKNMSTGYFGKVIAGVGNKGLYDEAANLSRFKGNQQISFIGQLNNTNKQNFTVQDILGGGGGRGGYAGGLGGGAGRNFGGAGGNRAGNGGGLTTGFTNNNNGITTTAAAGLNYRDNWGKNTQAAGSYFYNNLLTEKDQNSNTENFIKGDSSIFNNQDQASRNRNVNQRLNFNIETNFDSVNSMIIRPNASIQQSDGSSSTTTSTTRGTTVPISNSTAHTNTHNSGYNGSADILFRHKFAKKGRTFSLGVSFGGNSNTGNGENYSKSVYHIKATDSTSIIDQHYNSKVEGQNISANFAYTEPLGKHSILELNYNYSYNKNTADKYTFDYDSAAKAYNIPDSLLTNTYENTYFSHRATLSYLYQNEKVNFSIGSGVQFGNLTSNNSSKNITLTQHYTNIYPSANLTYRFTNSTTLRFNYSGRTSQPTAQQLQPVIDNSDPMNIQIGNPNLKQSFTNSFRLLLISFNRTNFHNMFASINANFVSNNIVNSTITNVVTGVDSIKPVNLNGTYNLSAFFNYGFPIKKPKSNINFTTNISDTRGVSLLDTTGSIQKLTSGTPSYTTNYTLGETIKWTTNLKNNFDMNFAASPTYNIAKYSQSPSSNLNYFSLALTTDFTWYSKSGWLFSPDFTYTYYGGRAAGYNTSVPLLNVGFAKQFLKNKAAELRLTVYDLLNQNVSIQRNVTENYVQDIQTKTLTRYVLLTFTYNLRSFQGSQQNRRGGFGFPGGGGFRGGGGFGRPEL